MSDFRSHGFLGDVSDWTKGYHRQFAGWLTLYTEFNSFAQGVFFRCNVQSNDLRRLLAKTLYLRILGNYQAAFLLGERGMEAEAKILVRSLCEATFALVAISKDATFAKRYIGHNEAKRLKNIDRAVSFDSEHLKAEWRQGMSREQKILRAKKAADPEMKVLEIAQIAEIAQMTDIYHSIYPLFSLTVHALPQDLATYLVTDSDGRITHLRFAPTHKDSEFVLSQSMNLITRCAAAMGNLFEFDISIELNSFIERMNHLFEDSKKQPTSTIVP